MKAKARPLNLFKLRGIQWANLDTAQFSIFGYIVSFRHPFDIESLRNPRSEVWPINVGNIEFLDICKSFFLCLRKRILILYRHLTSSKRARLFGRALLLVVRIFKSSAVSSLRGLRAAKLRARIKSGCDERFAFQQAVEMIELKNPRRDFSDGGKRLDKGFV